MNRDELLALVGGPQKKEDHGGKNVLVLCPAHDDSHPSLAVAEASDGRILLHCNSYGCNLDSILAGWQAKGLNVTKGDLFADKPVKTGDLTITNTYDYGPYEVVRLVDGEGKKTFRQRRKENGQWVWNLNGVERVLYQRKKVSEAVGRGDVVYVVEGEKDVHTLLAKGFTATTNSGGAKKWEARFSDQLVGAKVVVIPDNDPPGRAHAQRIFSELESRTPVTILELPVKEKGDVTDWMHAGGTAEKLEAMTDKAFAPKTKALTREEVFHLALAQIDKQQKGEIIGLSWPDEWPSIHRTVGPIMPGMLTVIGAKTSHGKSIAAQQLSLHVAQDKKNVLMVTLELTPERMMAREFASFGANIDNLKRKSGARDADWSAIWRYQDDMKSWGECWYLHAFTVEEMAHEVDILKPDIVIVDYLHRIHRSGKDEYHSLTNNMNDLQDITLRRKVPVVVLSQLRRPEGREEFKRPHMSDLRGSGAIEERAANILLMHRIYEDDGHGGHEKTNKGFFFIEKNADGEAGVKVPIVYQDGSFRVVEQLQ